MLNEDHMPQYASHATKSPIKRFIDCFIPIETCNLKCHYCYIFLLNRFGNDPPKFQYSPVQIRQALSVKRMGGICLLNLCAGGETLIAEEVVDIVYQLLDEGHYVMLVTNGILKNRFEEISKFPVSYLERLFIKFSFHYKELLRTQKIDLFFSNVSMMQRAGCSFTVELTPNDESVKDIECIKEVCIKKLGVLCHVTIARDDTKANTPLLTKYSIDEYKKTWGTFNSPLFDLKMDVFDVPRKEFCYAGDWSFWVNVGTGEMKQCYKGGIMGNIFDNPEKPIKFTAIGHYCAEPYCYNGHAFLTLGVIPELETPTYADMRNRISDSGEEWLGERMKYAMEAKLKDNNKVYDMKQKKKCDRASRWLKYRTYFLRIMNRVQ